MGRRVLTARAKRSAAKSPAGDGRRRGSDFRELQFALAYVENGGNLTQAAIAAGFGEKNAATMGSRLFKRDSVKNMVALLEKKVQQRADVVVERQAIDKAALMTELGWAATFDPGDLFDQDGEVKPMHQLPPHVRRSLVTSVRLVPKKGKAKGMRVLMTDLRPINKLQAIQQLGPELGLIPRHTRQGEPTGDQPTATGLTPGATIINGEVVNVHRPTQTWVINGREIDF